MDTSILFGRWVQLWECIAPRDTWKEAPELFAGLACHNQEPGRAYHNFEHIDYCLGTLDEHLTLAHDLNALEMAVFFHDVIYATEKHPKGYASNELLSAVVADQILMAAGIDFAFRQEVFDLIMVTRHLPGGATTDDQKLLADIDWSPMGWPWEQFEANRAQIREEYRAYSDEEFHVGREKFLRDSLARERLFYLPEFFDRFETPARTNMARELQLLSA